MSINARSKLTVVDWDEMQALTRDQIMAADAAVNHLRNMVEEMERLKRHEIDWHSVIRALRSRADRLERLFEGTKD